MVFVSYAAIKNKKKYGPQNKTKKIKVHKIKNSKKKIRILKLSSFRL